MAGNLQSLTFTDQSDSEEAKKAKEVSENFLNFTYHHKTLPGQETSKHFSNCFLKNSTYQMFEYQGLDAGLNT